MDGVFIEEALWDVEQLVGSAPPEDGEPAADAAVGAGPAASGPQPFAAASKSMPLPLSPTKSTPVPGPVDTV